MKFEIRINKFESKQMEILEFQEQQSWNGDGGAGWMRSVRLGGRETV